MKKNLLKVIALCFFATTAMVSCSSDDSSTQKEVEVNPNNPDNPNNPNNPGNPTEGNKVYKHRVLIEDFTGAWCQWCPRVAYSIEQAEASYHEDIVVAAIHNSQDPNVNSGGHDPFHLAGQNALLTQMDVQGFPSVFINRTKDWKYPEDNNIQDPKSYLQTGSPIGIKIQSNLTGASGTVNVSLKFSFDYTEQLKYVVYILEDGLVFRQANATTHYGNNSGTARWENNFVHNSVVRSAGANILGTNIPLDKSKNNQEFTSGNLNFTYTSSNANKLKVAVVVLDASGKALNAQVTPANTTIDYVLAN